MQFEPVWLSSIEHMRQFDELYARTHWLPRAIGVIDFPTDFPRMEILRVAGQQLAFPIVMFAEGRFHIEADTIEFQSYSATNYKRKFHDKAKLHLRTDAEFRLNASEIVSVELAPWQSPVLSYYDIPFTRIQARGTDDVARDFLICVGAYGLSTSKMHEQSARLANELQRVKSG